MIDAKLKEWRDWGKDAYKSAVRMMSNNSRHPNYDTPEKRMAYHDANEAGTGEYAHNFTDEGMAKLKTRFNYTDEDIAQAKAAWIDGYKASRAWYAKADAKMRAILDKYQPIFTAAEEYAKTIDVSDLHDGFPCGSAHLYVQRCGEMEELRKALGHFESSESEPYKYKLPIRFPHSFQCIAYDERYCDKVGDFLRQRGIIALRHSWID